MCAYMSKERKESFAPAIKALCKKYGFKGTLSIDHYSTIVLTIWNGKHDLLGMYNKQAKEDHDNRWPEQPEYTPATYFGVQPYCNKWFNQEVTQFFKEALTILHEGNHNNTDIMTDYFDVGWYVDINVGKWNKPYKLIK